MKLYAILIPETDGNFLYAEKCSISKEAAREELNKIISTESKGLSYVALVEFDVNNYICDLTEDYNIIEAYKPRFRSYGEWRKINLEK